MKIKENPLDSFHSTFLHPIFKDVQVDAFHAKSISVKASSRYIFIKLVQNNMDVLSSILDQSVQISDILLEFLSDIEYFNLVFQKSLLTSILLIVK